MKTLQEMLQTPEIQAINSDKDTMKLKKEDLAKLLLGFYNWYKEQEKGESYVSESNEEQQEVDYLATKSGEEMPSDEEGYAASLLQAEQYIPEVHDEPQSAKKAVKPVTQTKEKQIMKKETIIVEVYSKEDFILAVRKAMNEGRITTLKGDPSAINCVVSEKNGNIVVEFNVAMKENQEIIVKYYLPENFKAIDFVNGFATMMTRNAILMKRNIFNMSVSLRIYNMLKKKVTNARADSALPIIIKTVEGKAVMMLKDGAKKENEILVSVTKA